MARSRRTAAKPIFFRKNQPSTWSLSPKITASRAKRVAASSDLTATSATRSPRCRLYLALWEHSAT
eukprot:7715712-Lingulodinium_polyedra.AAC.1